MTDLNTSTAVDPIWFIENLALVRVDGADVGGAYGAVELTARAGDMPPLHVHHRDEELFYVLEGTMTLFVGDERILLAEGQSALAPRDVPHTYRVDSELARWLTVNSPSGFEEFIRAAGTPAEDDGLPPAGRPVDPAALAAAAAEYGIEILGPPGALPGGQAA